MYCNKCHINFSRLENDGDNGDYCPVCKSDMFLEDQKSGPTYFMDLNMNIVDSKTGEIKNIETPALPVSKKTAPLYTKTLAEHERDQERMADAVDAYMKSGNDDDYFKTLSGCGTINS